MHTRYCPDCDDEFRADIVRCSDCGGELVDRYEDEEGRPPSEPEKPSEPEEPVVYLPMFSCMEAATLKQAADTLAAAGIAFRASGCATGFQLHVSEADRSAAAAALRGREGVLAVPDDTEPSVGPQGGTCPACASAIPAAANECAECGLVVGGEPDGEE